MKIIKLFFLCLLIGLFFVPICYTAETNTGQFETTANPIPDDAYAHYKLGTEYDYHGRLDDAISEYQMAISLKHDYADPHYRLEFIFQYRGLYDEAIGELNKFIEFASPEDKRLEKAKEMIEYIKDKNEKQTEKAAATKIIYPILIIGFPLIYLILIYLYTKNKKNELYFCNSRKHSRSYSCYFIAL